MKNYNLIEKFLEIFTGFFDKIEFYFAKRWLNKHFGNQEYWGDYISELIHKAK